jgi:hypothetical protein
METRMTKLARLYERYNFSASAVIIDASGAEVPARIANISFGGCRLLTNRKLPIASDVTIKIHAIEDDFAGPAKVVHSSDTDAGVMFGNLTADALFVLQKWIQEARYIQTMDAAE